LSPQLKNNGGVDAKKWEKKALNAVKNGQIGIHPPEADKIWSRWLENIRDWCLSRQLWWDHLYRL
jgi:valyl-tRNA synthetase